MLSNAVTIPLTVTAGTARSQGDHGTLTSITINSGATSGTGTITTNQDTDTYDETFTVALNTAMLPASVTPGASNSELVTITDDDRQFELSVDATPACGTTVTDTLGDAVDRPHPHVPCRPGRSRRSFAGSPTRGGRAENGSGETGSRACRYQSRGRPLGQRGPRQPGPFAAGTSPGSPGSNGASPPTTASPRAASGGSRTRRHHAHPAHHRRPTDDRRRVGAVGAAGPAPRTTGTATPRPRRPASLPGATPPAVISRTHHRPPPEPARRGHLLPRPALRRYPDRRDHRRDRHHRAAVPGPGRRRDPLLVAEDTDSGTRHQLPPSAHAVEAATYYLAVSAGRGSGEYRLAVHYTPAFAEQSRPRFPPERG